MLQGAQEQFRKVQRLVQLKQFQSARLQLREGIASSLRKDLRDVEDLYPAVSTEVCFPNAAFWILPCGPAPSVYVIENTLHLPSFCR